MIQSINLALRFLLELAALASLCYWGFQIERGLFIKILFGIGTPVLAAIVWGIYGAPGSARELHGAAHMLLELMIFGSAAAALYVAGHHMIAVAFLLIVLSNRVLMFIWNQ